MRHISKLNRQGTVVPDVWFGYTDRGETVKISYRGGYATLLLDEQLFSKTKLGHCYDSYLTAEKLAHLSVEMEKYFMWPREDADG